MTCRPTGYLILVTIDEHVARIDMKREAKAYGIFVWEFLGNRALERARRKWEDSIKTKTDYILKYVC